LATFASEFSRLLGIYQETSDEISRNISELSELFREQLYKVNSIYAASKGEDLFKMTNKSIVAFQKLAVPTNTFSLYADLVDALYFLIDEGSGSCKRLPQSLPEFAMDIKFLCTDLRHDIDHGKEFDIAKKRKRNAEIFAKYAYKQTPGECSPEDFLAAHIRLLQASIDFLQHKELVGN
jgi:hypothetical protein